MLNVINRQNLAAALDAVSSGGKTCATSPSRIPAWRTTAFRLNAFGPSAASAAGDRLRHRHRPFNSTTVMNDVTAARSPAAPSTTGPAR
jgi:iron complex outermembrane receptor protein